MPGLIGITKNSSSTCNYSHIVKSMQDLMLHRDFYVSDDIFEDRFICASRIHKGIEQNWPQPFIANDVKVWVDGEFFKPQVSETVSDAEYLGKLYLKSNKSFDFLKSINGIYSAIIYDELDKTVHLISDQFGLKPIYYTILDKAFCWSSEVKCFLNHPSFTPIINPEAMSAFFKQGYMSGDSTWFKDVHLAPHSSILTFNLQTEKISDERYWSFDQISILENKNVKEITTNLGYLFKQAVERCCSGNYRYGLSLSAGLDSRALVAAAPESSSLSSFTFGKNGCVDIEIARKVSTIKGIPHRAFELNSTNWFLPRLEGVWLTDGHFNILHMHGMEFHQEYRSMFDIQLNGFLGDAIQGGSYLARTPFEKIFLNRGRRFIRSALCIDEADMHVRLPFLDKDLMEYTLSIPISLRKYSFIYARMLSNEFPKYFKTIKWEKTGFPIGYPYLFTFLSLFSRKISNRYFPFISKLLFKSSYTNYPEWIRHNPSLACIKKLLTENDSIYKSYIDPQKVQNAIESHLRGNDQSVLISKVLTFEIWLRQVFQKTCRNATQITL